MTDRSSTYGAHAHVSLGYMGSVALVLCAGIVWSTGGLWFRLVEEGDALQIMFFRSLFLIVAISIAIVFFNRGRLRSVLANAGVESAIGGLCIATASFSFLLSLEYTTVANAVFMLAAVPFFAALLGWWILGEMVRGHTWVAMALAAIGLCVMVVNGISGGGMIGNTLALYAAFAAAAFSVMLRWGADVDMMPAIFYAGLFGAAVSFVCLLLPMPWRETWGVAELTLPWRDIAICAIMGFGQLGLGLSLYTIGARTLSATEITLLSLSEPLLAPVWVWLAVAEVPETLTLVGGAILMSGIVYQALTGARRKRAPSAAR